MPDKITLDVVTPTRRVFSQDVDEVVFPGSQGYLGVRPGHTPLLAGLGVGVISWTRSGRSEQMSVALGYAEVLPNQVSILAETAELSREVDADRARQSKERAEKRLSRLESGTDLDRAQASLARAEARLLVAAHGGRRTP